MEELDKALDDLIFCIKESKDYKECISLKEQMNSNTEIKSLISEIKELQKKYIKSNYDSDIKRELDILEEKLKAIPIYVIYTQTLNKVNSDINRINDRFNDYFDKLFNE